MSSARSRGPRLARGAAWLLRCEKHSPKGASPWRQSACPPGDRIGPKRPRLRCPRLRSSTVSTPRFGQPTASTTGSAGTWLSIRFATARANLVPINRSRRNGNSRFPRSRAYRHRMLPTNLWWTDPREIGRPSLAIEASGCRLGTAWGPTTTRSRLPFPRVSLRSSSSSIRRNSMDPAAIGPTHLCVCRCVRMSLSSKTREACHV